MPTATPNATAARSPHTETEPPETSRALMATASNEGSAMVVVKPMAAAKA